jgi:hypothetical protein
VGHPQHLGEFGRDHDHRLPLLRQVVEDAVDLLLRADVDAAGRLVEDEDVAVLQQPLGDDDLLLIAAREVLDRLARRRRPDAQPADELLRLGAHLARLDEARPLEALLHRADPDVGVDVLFQQQPEVLAVLGEIADAVTCGVRRTADPHPAPFEGDGAGGDRVGADEGTGQLGASGAHQARQAEDFTAFQLQRDVLQQVLRREPFDGEHGLAVLAHALRARAAVEFTADHARDDLPHGGVRRRERVDVVAVADDGDAVGDGLQLFHPV